eukprot:scaffold36275_cov154-Isochrysis_galbana.AAC.33
MAMAVSRAITAYCALDDAAGRRELLQTARLPISPKQPPSASIAKEPAIKSADRLFSTQFRRLVLSS